MNLIQSHFYNFIVIRIMLFFYKQVQQFHQENLEEKLTLIRQICFSMFQVFLKKQQYDKVSSKFKHHFQQRNDRVNFVKSLDTKIEKKMQMFKELINDGAKVEKKTPIIKASYFRQNKQLKTNQLFDREFSELGQMTDGFIEWNNAKLKKNMQKQNIFSWSCYKEGKKERNKKDQTNFIDILKNKLDLKELRMTHRSQKFDTKIKSRLENNILEKGRPQPLHLSCRHNSSKEIQIKQIFKEKDRKRYQLERYFGQMKEYSCNGKPKFQLSSARLKPLKNLDISMSSTAYCTPSIFKNFNAFTPFEDVSTIKVATDYQIDLFRDDKIFSDKKATSSQVQEPLIASSIPKEEINILIRQDKVQMITQNYNKIKTIPFTAVRLNPSHQPQKNVFRTTAHCPFDIKKLNAVRKVQCL